MSPLSLDMVQTIQGSLSVVALYLAIRLAMMAYQDRRRYARTVLAPVAAEWAILTERLYGSLVLLWFVVFMSMSTLMQVRQLHVRNTWLWAINGILIRVIIAWWVWHRVRSRKRLRALVKVTEP